MNSWIDDLSSYGTYSVYPLRLFGINFFININFSFFDIDYLFFVKVLSRCPGTYQFTLYHIVTNVAVN